MQILTITGRLGQDAKIHSNSTSGNDFITFPVAVDTKVKGKDVTVWYDVLTNSTKRYTNMLPYLKKGTPVMVVGDLNARVEVGNDNIARLRMNLTADRIDFNGSASGQNRNVDGVTSVSISAPSTSVAVKSPAPTPTDSEDEDIAISRTTAPVAKARKEPVPASDDEDLPF